MPHDFKNFPELTNQQMQFYYFESPHKQIREDIIAKVINVHDGDTITVRWQERNFDFPVRFARIAAPELNEENGIESRNHLKELINNAEIEIRIDPENPVEKWGRLLGEIFFNGININDQMMNDGFAVEFERRAEGKIPNLNEVVKWA